MHQTIYGETPRQNVKTRVESGSLINNFLENSRIKYDGLTNSNSCLYSKRLEIDDPSVNYLNIFHKNMEESNTRVN